MQQSRGAGALLRPRALFGTVEQAIVSALEHHGLRSGTRIVAAPAA